MKKKIILICCVVLAVAAAVTLIGVAAADTKAANEPEKNLSTFLEEKKISYSDADVSDGVLTIALCSSGEGRCTQDDIKAIQAIYDMVHAQSILGEVNSIDITIRDIDGAVIFNRRENDVSVPLEADTFERAESAQMTMQEKSTAADYARTVAAMYPLSVDDASVEQTEGLDGNKLVLNLTASDYGQNYASAIFDAFEAYAAADGKITQCEITMYDPDGNCAVYMAGDFQYGNRVAWVSPAMEASFIAAEGPRPNDE